MLRSIALPAVVVALAAAGTVAALDETVQRVLRHVSGSPVEDEGSALQPLAPIHELNARVADHLVAHAGKAGSIDDTR